MAYEYIVVTLASVLAGIGTGLVGLSAATAMVPLLIVILLCKITRYSSCRRKQHITVYNCCQLFYTVYF